MVRVPPDNRWQRCRGSGLKSFGTGVGESLWGIGETAVQFSPARVLVDPGGFATDIATTIDGVIWGAQHPKEFGKAVVDWDMWKEDPARALGRLVPDLAAAAASGGSTAAAKGGRTANLLSRIGVQGLREVPSSRLARLGRTDEWLTGARRRPRDILDDPAQTKWAEDAYADFMRDDRDVSSISGNTRDVPRADGSYGFSEEEIASIKKHVFDTEHPIEDYETGEVVTRKFDADAEIADAWIRLRAGRSLPEDHILLEHELTDLGYLRDRPGATYQEAHRVANESYNWQSKVPLEKREDFESEW